jgi:hypothetical protein
MKRDWDIIRDILIKTEKLQQGETFDLEHVQDDQQAAYAYHVEIMKDAGLLNATIAKDMSLEPNTFFIQSMTWEGHELIDAIRNDTVWAKTKKVFKDKGITMTFELVKAAAVETAKTLLGV